MSGECIRVTGIVQGVGFRPTVWRLARECGLVGRVWNDAEGVSIHAWGSPASLENLVRRLQAEPPPLEGVDADPVAFREMLRSLASAWLDSVYWLPVLPEKPLAVGESFELADRGDHRGAVLPHLRAVIPGVVR